ncbi:MAG: hypothetical protein ACE5RQ_03615 [Nitrosopumilus sp.]|jgi:NTP pyrophosphatase (non-canonical NTP hydrolase)|uniref:Uncharacterized protein n=1 Tax=Candidatus Nitrosomaritimum aestuariumsis TaxID=3342354 RepID=A0AC60VY38_9ARCH|nr:hypothetical protein [Nitrosopumilaceae archaeon]NCF22215.1 hypothetical protein [Nitrosopumilaceae archaeon]
MKKLDISSSLEEKIYDCKYEKNSLSQISTYFPLEETEKQEILKAVQKEKDTINFKSIFSDKVSEDEWNKNKEQIKKKFHDELFDID